ncbi:MAG: HAD-IIIA family hydrolase [Ktedonobacteraceae bacterium]|nr:HAD-IIIA family hydrolase [Ktedonobacteraceae bacterium]MBO0792107.1 HAD-IIIA family hydrolase [Ktedonobacteraceae bacterium]
MEKHYSAYFFDLGGTLLALEHDEIARSETGKVTLLPGVRDHLLSLVGTPVFVITNQAGVALGHLSEATARSFIDQVNAAVGQVITDYRICMHHPLAGCPCRKPQPGMVLDLARTHAINLAEAAYIGDTANDEQCAQRAGVGTFLWAPAFFREI